MGIIEWLDQTDKALFMALNQLNSPFFDPVFYAISGKLIWVPLYLFLIFLLYRVYNKKFWIFLIAALLAVGLSDFTASGILKPTVERLRPTRNPEISDQVHIVNQYRGGLYGFASSHAANTFAIALFFWLSLKQHYKKAWWLIVWAALVSYSRIYLGVHYPGDILAGGLIGSLWASMFFFSFKRLV